ncbi:MAG: dipeptidase [Bacteroidota bacterium]|nr:dipeptidase [Bacteroidota bacterium]
MLLSLTAFQTYLDYKKIHHDAYVFDGHNDAVHRLLAGEDLGLETTKGHIDIPRLKSGGVDASFFSVWVPPAAKSKSYFNQANSQIEALIDFAKKYPASIQVTLAASDLEKIRKEGKIALLISMEGAHPLGDSIRNLDYFYSKGVRSIMPTWNNSTSWATSAEDETNTSKKLKYKGLTDLGKNFIQRMDELGIIIDVSHAGEKTFWDIIETSKNPIIASHSSVWNIFQHWRNLKDDQIKAIANTGGLVAVNFAPYFLDKGFGKKVEAMRKRHDKKINSLKKSWKGSVLSREEMIGRMLKEEYAKILPTISDLVDHLDYVVKLVGVDYVGLGSDFDGIGVTPKGLDDVSHYPEITKELVKRGYSENDIRKILGGNFLRVIEKVLK